MSMEVTNNNPVKGEIWEPVYEVEQLLTFAGAGTVIEGTMLARKAVDTAIVVTAGTNTGDGTVTAVVSGSPIAGDYNLECTFQVAEGGVFKLEGPGGQLIADNLTLRVGSGLVTTLTAGGITFTVTDGAADFDAGDTFSAAVVANGNYVPFATDGVAGANIPTAIITCDVVATGAGNEPIRPMIGGQYRSGDLVIDADGDNSNVTDAIIDQLRDFTIIGRPTTQLAFADNQ